jgi:hypothetical protein
MTMIQHKEAGSSIPATLVLYGETPFLSQGNRTASNNEHPVVTLNRYLRAGRPVMKHLALDAIEAFVNDGVTRGLAVEIVQSVVRTARKVAA